MDTSRLKGAGKVIDRHKRIKANVKGAKAPHVHEKVAAKAAGNEKAAVKKSSVKRHKGTC